MKDYHTNSDKVRDFMTSFDEEIKKKPDWPEEDVINLRIELIDEEFKELKEAVYSNDGTITDVADALSDILYVTYGMAHSFGINIDECFREVHVSNMSKLGEDGKPIYREDGKVIKGPNYSPPNLTEYTKGEKT